ncbi:MAG: phenylalanine--tRNA ligase subunit beta [Patescibacteria group bacterium]|nr:phenylalanine--tRNA ligase subunit beta [Patescibacteria group bacterium]
MLFSYEWLQSFFKKKLPAPEKLAEILTLHSFEVEEIKKNRNDLVFDLDITANRAADCFSHIGIARECAALVNLKLQIPDCKIKEGKEEIKNFIKAEVKDKKDCLRYTGRVIKGIKVKESPKHIKDRLKSCGLDPINNIVDAANYVMLEFGQPLHVFDLDKIGDSKIIVRRARNNEKIETLDDKAYKLDESILVIADSKKPLAIAGMKGGKGSAIDSKTKNIFLESANFDPLLIRKTSKKLALKTDASFRFEHGMDSNMTEIAVDRLANLINELAGGEIAKHRVDIFSGKTPFKKIKLDLRQAEKLLGIKISKNEVIKILKSLGFEIDSSLQVKVPSNRPDIKENYDLIEEIGRIYGYEKIKPVFPILELMPAHKNERIVWKKRAKNILTTSGFFEVYNYSFISKKAGDYLNSNLVELENPFSEQFYYLRPNLLINLLDNISHKENYSQRKEKIQIFELGTVFKEKASKIEEKKMLAGVIFGDTNDFYILKGVIDNLLNGLGISDIFYDNFEATPDDSQKALWNLNKSAEIKINGKEIGFLGELSSRVLSVLGVKISVVAFEIDFDKLIKFCSEEQEYLAISKFPSAVRDVAILLPSRVRVADVLNIINITGGDLIQDVDLFDIYEGGKLAEGRKSLAFHIVFQSQDKTLSGKEIDKLFQKIIKALEENADWEVRK